MRHYSAATNHRAEPLAARKVRVHENARLCVCACVRACVAQGSADSGTLRASCIRIYIYIPLVQVAPPKKPLSLGLVYTSLLRLSFPPSSPLPSSFLFFWRRKRSSKSSLVSSPVSSRSRMYGSSNEQWNEYWKDGGGAINNDSRDENGDSHRIRWKSG